jgi:hypothetical protein
MSERLLECVAATSTEQKATMVRDASCGGHMIRQAGVVFLQISILFS